MVHLALEWCLLKQAWIGPWTSSLYDVMMVMGLCIQGYHHQTERSNGQQVYTADTNSGLHCRILASCAGATSLEVTGGIIAWGFDPYVTAIYCSQSPLESNVVTSPTPFLSSSVAGRATVVQEGLHNTPVDGNTVVLEMENTLQTNRHDVPQAVQKMKTHTLMAGPQPWCQSSCSILRRASQVCCRNPYRNKAGGLAQLIKKKLYIFSFRKPII